LELENTWKSGRGHTCYKMIFTKLAIKKVGRDSVVGIASRYGLDSAGIEFWWGGGERELFAPIQTGTRAHPASYRMGTGSFPEVKRPGRGLDHPSHLVPNLKKE
jgi:hypothetical protein